MISPLRALLLLLMVAGVPLDGDAQQRADSPRVAFIATTSTVADMAGPHPKVACIRRFVHGMRELGYADGGNVALDMRSLNGRLEQIGAVARDLVERKTDVIVLPTPRLVPAVRRVSRKVPLVILVGAEIEQSGLIRSLARPGGDLTGLSVDAGVDQEAKRLELLHEIRAETRRVAYLASEELWRSAYGKALVYSAKRLGITLVHIPTVSAKYTDAFADVSRARVDALLVAHGPVEYGHRAQIGEFAAKSGLLSSCAHGEAVESGCLVSYGVDLPEVCGRLAGHVERILKGVNAGDLPIELPTKFELVVNLRTAKALGVSVPPALLLRADRVIE